MERHRADNDSMFQHQSHDLSVVTYIYSTWLNPPSVESAGGALRTLFIDVGER